MSFTKIPRQAEALFEGLCAAHGVTCNKSTEDERGWDYFVQFARPANSGPAVMPPDMLPEADKCLVQIKSSKGKPSSVRVKVSNAMEFAKSGMPCFIVLFRYERDKHVSSILLLHFWKSAIEATLRKAREFNAKGRNDLHRVTIRFPVAAMVRVESVDLLATMEKMIADEGPGYPETKHAYAESVGFGAGYWTGNVAFKATIEDIVDMTLGLRAELPASSITLRNVRFGIESKPAVVDSIPGRASFRSHPTKCAVVISSEPHGNEVSLAADLYIPAIPGLSREQIRYRIVHRHMELLCVSADARGNFHCTCDTGEKGTINDISTLLDLMHVFASSRIHFIVTVEGRRLLGGTGTVVPLELPPVLPRVKAFLRLLLENTRPHEIPAGLTVSVDDLAACDAVIQECLAVALEPAVTGNLHFHLPSEFQPFSGDALLAPCVQLSGYCINVIVKRRVRVVPGGIGKMAFELGEIHYVRIRILSGTLAETEHVIAQEVEVCKRESTNARVMIFPRRPPEAPLTINNQRID